MRNEPGDTFGQWTLTRYIPGGLNPRRSPRWRCRCSCGVVREVQTNNLRSGKSTSCGHDLAERMSAGMVRYHALREQEAAPVATVAAANPWDVLRRYRSASA